MNDKRGFAFSFGWLFAVIVGSVIIFLAIYASVSFTQTFRQVSDSETAKQFGVLLSPVETSIETSSTARVTFPTEARVYNDCDLKGTFGTQKISAATKLGIGKEWEKPAEVSAFHNKYLFSNPVVQGKTFFVFTKTFEMPFKIADLMYIWSDEQGLCLLYSPEEVKNDFQDLKLNNKSVQIIDDPSKCVNGSRRVCFNTQDSDCDIVVNSPVSGSAIKGSIVYNKDKKTSYYDGYALMYAAIFSDYYGYECQVKRLMRRAAELGFIYKEKSDKLASESSGCSSGLQADLISYSQSALMVNKSADVYDEMGVLSDRLGRSNEQLLCKIF